MRLTSALSGLALISVSLASITRSTTPPEGYTIAPMGWGGMINGEMVNLTGSIQEIQAQLITRDPTYAISPPLSSSPAPSLAERWTGGTLCCPVPGQNWGNAEAGTIADGIAYLQRISGDCHLGPNQCSRISCSYGSAIWWCNQINADWYQNCGWLGAHAQTILNVCHVDYDIVCGQNFDAGGYNIVVQWDTTNGC